MSEGKLANVMSTLMDAPTQRSATPTPTPTPTPPPASPSPSKPPSQARTPTRQPIPSPSSLSPLGRSPGGSRPLLDPFEPLFTAMDEEDAKALEEIEGVIQLILDVTPRRGDRVRWHRAESAEVGLPAVPASGPLSVVCCVDLNPIRPNADAHTHRHNKRCSQLSVF